MLKQGRTSVRRNSAESRYEILVDGELAGFAMFYVDGDKVVLSDTQVAPDHRGERLEQELEQAVLAKIRVQGSP